MTVAELRAALAKLPDAMPVCFTSGEALLEIEEIESVSATGDEGGYTVTFDGARDDAVRVAVVS